MLDRSAYRHARALGCCPAEAAQAARSPSYWAADSYMTGLAAGRDFARRLSPGVPFLGASPIAAQLYPASDMARQGFRAGFLEVLPTVATDHEGRIRVLARAVLQPHKIKGRPSWRAIYSREPGRWEVVCNRFGRPIEYIAPGYALDAASEAGTAQ